jgi:exopolysaccharide production protein ExoQ
MLGFLMTLYSLFALWSALGERRSLLYWTSWAACILLAIVSRSATIAVTLVAAYYSWALCAAFMRARHRRSLVLYMALMPLVLLICAVVLFPDAFVSMLGKDTTLSGRDVLWAAVWDFIKERPLLGYGYGAFWRESGDEARLIWASLGWYPPHAHNAVLELLLQFGVLGLIGVTIYYGALWYRLFRAAAAGDMPGTAPLMAMMVAFLVQGVSEANMLHQGDIDWALTVYMAALFVRREAASGAKVEAPNPARWVERAARAAP